MSVDAHRSKPSKRSRLSGALLWGLLDQAASSASNFGLALAAGRILGPSGLGVVTLGFSAYLIILGFHRALVSEPLVVTSSGEDAEWRRRGARSSISATLGFGVTTSATTCIAGVLVGGSVGRGLLIIAPWILPALLQDLWRMLLFRDGRGSGASANDGLWVLTMFAAMPAAWAVGTDWAVVAAWGLGALAGAVLGVAQLRAGPARPRRAWDWVVADAWPLGRWLAAESVVYSVASQLALFELAAIVGAAAVGGLRSVQVLFAPLTLLGPALALPGLPAVRIALLDSSRAAMRVAMRLSGILVLLTSVYLLVSILNGGALLTAVFGTEFSLYRSLIWPVGTQQLISAGAAGPYMLLKASGRAKSILVTRLVSSIGMLVALALLAPRFGITGGAWALTLGTLIGGLLTATLVYVGRR